MFYDCFSCFRNRHYVNKSVLSFSLHLSIFMEWIEVQYCYFLKSSQQITAQLLT